MIIGRQIKRYDELVSTNLYLLDWLEKERPEEGTVVMAAYQTAGRGMDRNRWESALGMNLTFSFVLYPGFLSPDRQFDLNKAVSLGVSDFVRNEVPEVQRVKVKWPNDIYYDDRKLAGMLIQNGISGGRYDFAVIGIGVNINQETFGNYPVQPISLRTINRQEYDPDVLIGKLLECLDRRYLQLKQGLPDDLDASYLGHLYHFNESHSYLYRRKTLQARITGINQFGQLKLETLTGLEILCNMKEVKFL